VTATSVLPSFEEHRRLGLGHFVTRAELEKHQVRRVSDVLAQTPGVAVVSGIAHHAWIATSRGARSLNPKTCQLDQADLLQGARACVCYAQVYLDEALVYSGKEGEPLFDVNRLYPNEIEAMEYYASPARTPLKYSRLDSPCGVLVIHTRRTR
jgi:hypothetical protein